MARLGWILILLGLLIGAACLVLASTAIYDLDSGFFTTLGVAGAASALVGLGLLHDARRRSTPPARPG